MELTHWLVYLFSTTGLTVLVVWPETGPSAWLRDCVGKRVLPGRAKEVLDCYVCCGFWAGLLFSPFWWWLYGETWVWFGCLMVPAVFWFVLENRK